MKKALKILSILILYSCSSKYTVIQIKDSKTLLPEGIAIHPNTNDIYLSSVNENKLIKTNKNGEYQEDVIDRKQNGYSIGLGLDIHKNNIYALSSFDKGPKSILSIKHEITNKLNTYKFTERDSSQFNDLAIDGKGNAYITDSKNHEIFFFDNELKKITPFIKNEQLYYPNGIALNKKESKLFVASFTHGLRIIDLASKTIINPIHEATKNTGIDGLKYLNGNLYFIMNSRAENEIVRGLYKLKLNPSQTGFGEIETLLVNKDVLEDPTTLSIANNWIYVIGNSQLRKFDEKNQSIKQDAKLHDIKIIKIKIENGG